MDRPELIEKLEKATDRAATFAISRGYPIPMSKKSTLIGNVFVEKNSQGTYDVLKFDKTPIYENISVFDVAIIVAQRYNSGETSAIRRVLELEEKFAKYHTDMIHYLHCMRGAKKNHDHERMAILEDKFQVSETLAKMTRDKISVFKRVKQSR